MVQLDLFPRPKAQQQGNRSATFREHLRRETQQWVSAAAKHGIPSALKGLPLKDWPMDEVRCYRDILEGQGKLAEVKCFQSRGGYHGYSIQAAIAANQISNTLHQAEKEGHQTLLIPRFVDSLHAG